MKENILEIAFQLFLKNGFAEVSTNEIIREANVTKGCFYHYFKSKEELIYDVIVMYLYPYLESPIKALEEKNNQLDILQSIHFCYTFMPKLVIETKQNISFRQIQFLIYEGIKKYVYLAKKSCECSRKQRFLLKELLERGKKEGIVSSKIDTDTYATTMIALRDGMIALHILDNSIDTKEKWESTFQEIWKEIKVTSQDEYANRGGYLYAKTMS